jgi:hypothetical protein
MPFRVDKLRFNGRLDKDNDYSSVKPGNYLSAKNVSRVPLIERKGDTTYLVRGNKHVINIPQVAVSNKKYRIYIEAGAGVTQTIQFFDVNGNNFVTVSYVQSGTVAVTIAVALGALLPALAPYTPSVSSGLDFIDIELQWIPSWEWTIIRTSSSTDTENRFVVLQEAIDASLAGEINIIGEYDLVNNAFWWSTTQTELPSILGSGTMISNGAGLIRVLTSTAHGLVSGESIVIQDASNNANGTWIINVINTGTFDLLGSTWTGIGGACNIKINNQGYGQIGAVVYDANTDVWTYTRLIGSKEFNWVTKKQIDTYCEQTGIGFNNYYTDDYNFPGAFYYSGDFVTDGALSLNGGQYEYGTIGAETILMLSNTNFRLEFLSQDQSGGGIKPGNWRYTARLLTDNFVGTPYCSLTNPVSVFTASTIQPNAAQLLIGDGDNFAATGKINNLEATGIIPNVFRYIELAGIRYLDGNAVEMFTIRRDTFTGDSVELKHTGLETYTDVDISELIKQPAGYYTAKNITALDKRLILSNLTAGAVKDFSDFFSSFTHTLLKTSSPAVGNNLGAASQFFVAEYQQPETVYSGVGYMDNEVYRFGGRAKLKNGTITPVFWIDDIIFNTSAVNDNVPGQANPDNRRLAGLPDFNLTDAAAVNIFITHPEFANINPDFMVDGVRVRDIIDSIEVMRFELGATTREILSCGMFAVGVRGNGGSIGNPGLNMFYGSPTTSANTNIGEYPFFSGGFGNNPIGFITTPTYPSLIASGQILPTATSQANQFGALYYPDIFFGNTALASSLAGDQVIFYGSPGSIQFDDGNSGAATWDSFYGQYSGFTNVAPQSFNVLGAASCNKGGNATIGGLVFEKQINWIGSGNATQENSAGPVVRLTSGVSNISGNPDYGFYYTQYYRSKQGALKFGSINEGLYVTTGAYLPITSTTPVSNIRVFGGDTFVQKTYYKHRYIESPSTFGFGGGVAFYSQNLINTQMKRQTAAGPSTLYPVGAIDAWLEPTATEVLLYNKGYSIRNQISNEIAFDSNLPFISDLPTRKIYSEIKPINAIRDFYRDFVEGNFQDSDNTAGEIVFSGVLNGELITIQLRAFVREFFNTRGRLETVSQPTSIVIGDGSVLSRDGIRLTTYGSKHKWSVLEGRSKSGDDIIAWINTENQTVNHLGGNGLLTISHLTDMMSFFQTNLIWVNNHDTPADGTGICGVWDEKKKEFVWTVRGKRTVAAWTTNNAPYAAGVLVSYRPSVFSTFEQTGEIYRSLQNNNSATPGNTVFWELIPHTNKDYYNEYTIAFNEHGNTFGFVTEYTYLPKIYLKRGDMVLTPRPVSDTGNVYQHLVGNFAEWYEQAGVKQTEDGYIEMIFNADENLIKTFMALLITSKIVPYRIEFFTQNHESFLVTSDFEAVIDQFKGAIKNDSTGTGLNDTDTSKLWGRYIRIKFYFEKGIEQELESIVLKYITTGRVYNK